MSQGTRKSKLIITIGLLLTIALLSSHVASAANLKAPSAILSQYRDQRVTWFTNVWPYANNLFGMPGSAAATAPGVVYVRQSPPVQSIAVPVQQVHQPTPEERRVAAAY